MTNHVITDEQYTGPSRDDLVEALKLCHEGRRDFFLQSLMLERADSHAVMTEMSDERCSMLQMS